MRNTQISWDHVTTADERRAFLRAFFTFSGVSVSSGRQNLVVERSSNTLLEDIALLLKREGCLPVVMARPERPILMVSARADLERMVEIGILPAETLGKLQALSDRVLVNPQQYFAAIGIAREMGLAVGEAGLPLVVPRNGAGETRKQISPTNLVARCKKDLGLDLSTSTVKEWLQGRLPASVGRLLALESLEARRQAPEQLVEVAAAIQRRAAEHNFHPLWVVDAIANYFGGSDAFARRIGVTEDSLQKVLRREQRPDRVFYTKVLQQLGLNLEAEFARGFEPPSCRQVIDSFSRLPDRGLLETYYSAIGRIIEESFWRGTDPVLAVREKLKELQRRTQRLRR